MKLIIGTTEYDVTDSIQKATLGDLMKLKVKTKTSTFIGVTAKSINQTFIAIGKHLTAAGELRATRYAEYVSAGGDLAEDEVDLSNPDDWSTIDLLGDEDFLLNMQGLIYLARRRAGELLEVEDAADTPFDSFSLSTDDADEEAVTVAPKGLTDSAADDGPQLPTPSQSSTI